MKALSKSEIEAWLLCHRKWGLEKLNGLRYSNEYAAFGVRCAEIQERWLKLGQMPDEKTPEGKVVLAAMPHWPHPSKVQSVETDLYVQSAHFPYHGPHDLLFFNLENGLWTVGDLKTTGNLRYAKDSFSLIRDIQYNIYSLATMLHYNVEETGGRWVYVLRNKPHTTSPIKVTTNKHRVLKIFEDKIDPVADQIHDAYKQFGPGEGMELPPNHHSCGAFGGCPHVQVCNLSAKERLVSIMANDSLKSRLMSGGSLAKNVVPINGAAVKLETPKMEAKVDPATVPDDQEEQEGTSGVPASSLASKLGKPSTPKAMPTPTKAPAKVETAKAASASSAPSSLASKLKTAALTTLAPTGETIPIAMMEQAGLSIAVAPPVEKPPSTTRKASPKVDEARVVNIYVGCRPVFPVQRIIRINDYMPTNMTVDALLLHLLQSGIIQKGDAVIVNDISQSEQEKLAPYALTITRV